MSGRGAQPKPKHAGENEATPWHALDVTAVRRELESSEHGLTTQEAEERRAKFGSNELPEEPPPSFFELLLHQFKSPLIYVLLIAAVVTLALQDYLDASVIAAVLILNAVVGYLQESKAERSVRALMKLVTPMAHVLRDGHEAEIESKDLVPGDLVLLESGARIPADMRLESATSFMVDESLLTGESVPVSKSPDPIEKEAGLADRKNMLFTGSVVTTGRARGYVVATGTSTELGNIASEVRGGGVSKTPLQIQIDGLAKLIGIVVLVSSVTTFGIGLLIGGDMVHMFKVAVALAVAAIPEGLPIVLTITLALGVRRMARRHAVIRHLPAVDTLGSATVIGSDKTGTLTENKMTVQRYWVAGEWVDREGLEWPEDAQSPLRTALLAGVLANEASIGDGEEHGDPTELALLHVIQEAGHEPHEIKSRYQVEREIPFEPEIAYSAVYVSGESGRQVFLKGAPERVLGMSSQFAGGQDEGAVHQAADEMASQGLRVLALAYADLPEGEKPPRKPENLTFLGLVGMMDPPREGVKQAIDGCRRAGMRVLMITGDHAATARSIALDLGILRESESSGEVLTGRDLEKLSHDELCERVKQVNVYARVSPEQKLQIVRALRKNGEVVAVTGDGVNDAPALKAADIGVAMGLSGTDVAREASDMVLTDDNFVSIYAAVEEGRVTFDNLRKATFFLISTGIGAVLTILGALLLRWPIPFLPAQLLWMNLVTKGVQDVSIAFEPGEEGIIDRPPRRRGEGIMSGLLWERSVITGIWLTLGTLYLFWWELTQFGSVFEPTADALLHAQTVALTTMVIFQAFHVGNSRSTHVSLFRLSPTSNPFLLWATIGSVALHVAALYFPPTQIVLRVVPLSLEAWIRIVLVSLTIIIVIEVHKLLRRPPLPSKSR
jgi:calcium-translocating P-type ATPase